LDALLGIGARNAACEQGAEVDLDTLLEPSFSSPLPAVQSSFEALKATGGRVRMVSR
jgi:hypothetical protein